MDLFGFSKTNTQITLENCEKIKGLNVYFDFISNDEEIQLLQSIDNSIWLNDLKRRVQHYGYKYDYRSRRIDPSFFIGNIPEWMLFLITRLKSEKIINFTPDQAIINEYIDDQGIAPHIDCEPCFSDTIISISLGGHCVMNYQKHPNSKEQDKIQLFIPPKALLVMTGESRYDWLHGIVGRKSDKFNDKVYKRERRVSITFRKVIL